MTELPTGAVTFLFTDVEGSTRLVKQLRERYGEVLAEHQRLLREAFAASGSSGLAGVDANNVGVIDPATNGIVAQVPVGIRPGPVAAGNGAVWVANRDDRSVTRIDARRRAPAGTIALEDRTPTGIAVGGGAVWVAHGLLGQLSRVDPQFNQVAKALDVATRSEDGSLAVGDGSVWAVFGDSTLVRVDPTGPRVVASAFAGAGPAAIVVGGGAVWVANSADATVDRFNPTTFESIRAPARRARSTSARSRPRSPPAPARCGWPTTATEPSPGSTGRQARSRRRSTSGPLRLESPSQTDSSG